MLVLNSDVGALFMISKIRSAYNEIMNANQFGAKWLEIDDEEMAIKIKDGNFKCIGAIYGEEYAIIRFVNKNWIGKGYSPIKTIDTIIYLQDLIKKNNKLYSGGFPIGEAQDYTNDVG